MSGLRSDVVTLRQELLSTQFSFIPPGEHHLVQTIYPAVKRQYPGLCDPTYRCDDVHSSGANQPEWKHIVRSVQQQLADDEMSRIERTPASGIWRFAPAALYLQRVGEEWYELYKRTVDRLVAPPYRISPPESVRLALPARIWGTTSDPHTDGLVERMRPHDYLLLYHNEELLSGGTIGRKLHGSEVGAWLWNAPQLIYCYTVRNFRRQLIDTNDLWDRLDFQNPTAQDFTRVESERLEYLRDDDGDLAASLID